MTRVMSLRFREEQVERLGRLARRQGKTPSEAAVQLVEEALRQNEFGHIDFRNSPVGRQAYIQSSSLAVWEVVSLARSYGMDAGKTAQHLEWPRWRVEAALHYAEAYLEEIEDALRDNATYDFERVRRMLPQAEAISLAELAQRADVKRAAR